MLFSRRLVAIVFGLLMAVPPASRAGKCDWYNNSGAARSVPCFAPDDWGGGKTTTTEDCEAARSESKYKKWGCGNQDDGGTPSMGSGSCDSSSSCFGIGSLTDGLGIGTLGSLAGDMQAEADRLRKLQAKWLDSATSSLDGWERNLGTAASRQRGDITGLNHDRDLVSKAVDNFSGKGKFSPGDASAAIDPALKRDLTYFADAKAGEEAALKDLASAQKGLQALQAMKAATDGRNGNLNSLSDVSGTGSRGLASLGRPDGLGRPALPDPTKSGTSSNGASDITGEKEKALASEKSAGIGSGITAGGSDTLKGSTGEALRKQLAAALSADRKSRTAEADEEAVKDTKFQSDLAPGAVGHMSDAESKHALEEYVGVAKSPEFRLAGAETDREVKHLLAAEAEASQRSGGILSSESADLFQRVRRAHRSCVQRDCVALRAR